MPNALVTASVVKSIVVSGMSISSLSCAILTRRCDDVHDAIACVLTVAQQSDSDILLSLQV
jgi:hypothetical protein